MGDAFCNKVTIVYHVLIQFMSNFATTTGMQPFKKNDIASLLLLPTTVLITKLKLLTQLLQPLLCRSTMLSIIYIFHTHNNSNYTVYAAVQLHR